MAGGERGEGREGTPQRKLDGRERGRGRESDRCFGMCECVLDG